jgi:hypothetical protein
MKKLLFISALLLAGCGYDGKYRYECQDPENWEKSECQRPACQVDGACPDTLLGFDPSQNTVSIEPLPVEEIVTP